VDATAFRRYLQPSPTLRWHPWAPLVAGFLILGFAFFIGARWGYDAALRTRSFERYLPGFQMQVAYQAEAKSPGQRLVLDASRMDYAVMRFVDNPPVPLSAFQQWREQVERVTLRGGLARLPEIQKQDMVKLAEFRLRELSPAHARWQATASYCDDTARWRLGEEDVAYRFHDFARAYSQLLQREIGGRDIAPAVPGWKCPAPIKGDQK
jgi:hypothetical protein